MDLNSCIWVPGSGSQTLGPGLRVPDSGSRTPGPESQVPDSRIHLSVLYKQNQTTSRYLPDSTYSCLEFCSYIYVYFWIQVIADLDSCIWVPGSGSRTPCPKSRVPDSRIHLSMLGRNQGLKNYTNLFRLWTFFGSDLIDVNSFGMSCTFLVCLRWWIFELWSFGKIILSWRHR